MLVCFAALLAILAILGVARAHAAEAPLQAEPEVQLSEEEWELEEEGEECLEAEPGEPEEEGCEETEEESEQCPLRSAHAHLSESHNRLKLTIGYASLEPTPATVQIQSGRIMTFKRHLGKSGVLRFTENARSLNRKVVIRLEAVGWAGCPSRRLVLFRSEPQGASPSSQHRKS